MQKKDFLHSDFIPFDAVLDIMCLLNMAILRHCYITSLVELLYKQFQIVSEPANAVISIAIPKSTTVSPFLGQIV